MSNFLDVSINIAKSFFDRLFDDGLAQLLVISAYEACDACNVPTLNGNCRATDTGIVDFQKAQNVVKLVRKRYDCAVL
jgi:hypothetical protein